MITYMIFVFGLLFGFWIHSMTRCDKLEVVDADKKAMREIIHLKKQQLYEANEDLRTYEAINESLITRLRIATDGLIAVANQNAGQSSFEVWAKKLTSDALQRVSAS